MTTWNVVGATEHTSLGELQQPSAVGAGPEDGEMSFTDNATNSVDQTQALDHWVEAFDHEMTQNPDPEAAIAALAAKGCPDPEAVADMWIHLQENPDTTEDLSEMTPPEDPAMQAPPQELAQAPQQPLASTKTADISPDVAHFESLLHSGVDQEKLYRAFPQMHPAIDAAVERFGGGTAPIVNETPIQNPSREELNQDVRNTVQDLRSTLGSEKTADVYTDEYAPSYDRSQNDELYDNVEEDPTIAAKEWLHDCFDNDEGAAEYIEQMSPEETQAKVEQFYDGGWEQFLADGNPPSAESGPLDPDPSGGETPIDMAMRDGGDVLAKTADLAGKGPRRDKANEIYKAIRRDHPDKTKSEAAAIANDEANDLEKKDDLSLGNDDDKKSDKSSDSDKSDKSSDDDKKDDDGKPPWLKKKDARASYQGLNGRIAAMFEDVWQGKLIILATEHGDLTVPADEVGPPTEDVDAESNPVAEINEFLSIIDPAGHVPASYHARIENLAQVVDQGSKVIRQGSVSIADQMALDSIILSARAEITELTKLAEEYVSENDQAYLDGQAENAWGIGAGGVVPQADVGHQGDGGWLDEVYHDAVSDAQATDFDKIVSEEPALLVSDLPDAVLGDQGATAEMAGSYISSKTAMVPAEIAKEINTAFLANVEQARRVALAQRKAGMKKAAAALPAADGPAEGLFT